MKKNLLISIWVLAGVVVLGLAVYFYLLFFIQQLFALELRAKFRLKPKMFFT